MKRTLPLLRTSSTMRRVILVLLFCYPCLAEAQTYKTESGDIEFTSSVPLHSFTGVSDKLVGQINLADSTVDFYVDLNTLKTGISKRDRDMLNTLEADKYPFAEFYGKLVSGFSLNSTEPQKVTVEGTFKVHDVSREVSINGVLQNSDDGLQVMADWTLDMEDYDIRPPGILFYRVSEIIEVSIDTILPKVK